MRPSPPPPSPSPPSPARAWPWGPWPLPPPWARLQSPWAPRRWGSSYKPSPRLHYPLRRLECRSTRGVACLQATIQSSPCVIPRVALVMAVFWTYSNLVQQRQHSVRKVAPKSIRAPSVSRVRYLRGGHKWFHGAWRRPLTSEALQRWTGQNTLGAFPHLASPVASHGLRRARQHWRTDLQVFGRQTGRPQGQSFPAV